MKRTAKIVAIGALFIFFVLTLFFAFDGNCRAGDVDQDGKLTEADVRAVQQHIMRLETLTGPALVAADANKDGVINVRDMIFIQKKIK